MPKKIVVVGKDYYCNTLEKRVRVIYISTDYVLVMDEDKCGHDVPANSLEEIDWTGKNILEREG